jgi:prevent-host-death family protein
MLESWHCYMQKLMYLQMRLYRGSSDVEGAHVNVDTRDMISVTEASREVSRLVTEAAEDGRTWVVMKSNRPAAMIVGMAQMERLQRVDDLEQDLRLWAVALVRSVTDDGERFDLDDVAREFGVDLDDDED